MKRIILFTLALILITSSAFALTENDLALYHNQVRGTFGAAEIHPDDMTETGWLFCPVAGHIFVAYKIDSPRLVCGCSCQNESEAVEFFAQCETACIMIGNQSNSDQYSAVILRQFLRVRNGQENEVELAGDLYIRITKSGDSYRMTAFTLGF